MPRSQNRYGFTLVEMLVSVTLVLLMMTMFAQIFQMAGGSISKQRGLAENDQRSRTLQTIIKADLDKRTNRWVHPFAAGEDVAAPESYVGKRQGYLYISENDPTRSDDDLIQFTVLATMTARNKDQTPYYGKATNLVSFGVTVNQPDADDAQSTANDTGLSTVAEVTYFLRNGNLYRRQLLVREPLAMFSTTPQPTDTNFSSNNDLFDINSNNPKYSATGAFWNDFDYTAFRGFSSTGTACAQFLGTDHLDNSGKTVVGIALAKPQYRFGFSPQGIAGVSPGRSKEFAGPSTGADYFGRFTMQECSDSDFRYPQSTTTAGNIPTSNALVLTLDPLDGTVTGPDDFSNGPRRGEDLLMSNVHEFDIQVWDTNFGGFVNIADPSLPATADFAQGKRSGSAGSSYGPRIAENVGANAINAVFDTWHPQIGIDFNGDGTTPEPPPYRPIRFRPDYVSGTEPLATNNGGSAHWLPTQKYFLGDIVFPTAAGSTPGSPFFYRCIDISRPPKAKGKGKGKGLLGNNESSDTEPVWPKAAGLTYEDNAIVWQAVDNRKPLRAIKIEVRFVDPSTQQMRQLTLIQSLVD